MCVCRQAPCFKSKFITAEIELLFSQSDSEEEFEGFSDVEEEDDKGDLDKKQQVWSFFFEKIKTTKIWEPCLQNQSIVFCSCSDAGLTEGQWCGHRILLRWWGGFSIEEEEPFSCPQVCVCVRERGTFVFFSDFQIVSNKCIDLFILYLCILILHDQWFYTLEDNFSLIFTKLFPLLRFPVKRLSAAKQEPREKEVAEAVQETPPRRGRGRRRMKETQLEGKKEEEEISEEGLTQSLQKRDQNIQENKAMVGIPLSLSPFIYKGREWERVYSALLASEVVWLLGSVAVF